MSRLDIFSRNHPLSAAQRSRWLQYQLDPAEKGKHNSAFCARVKGLTPERLTAALNQLLMRHPMLRASFGLDNGELGYRISDDISINVLQHDAQQVSAKILQQQVAKECRYIFDLSKPLRIHACWYQCSVQDAIMVLVFDHIAVDGWSYWMLLEELRALLSSQELGPVSTNSFQDYVAWQNKWLQGSEAAAQGHFWQQTLSGALPVLQWPNKCNNTNVSKQQTKTLIKILPLELVSKLQGVASHYGGSLFAIFLAAYQILLHRYTGLDDIIVGTIMPGRGRARWGKLVGEFINPVALRCHVSDDITVSEHIHRSQYLIRQGVENQKYPFSQVLEQLRLPRQPDIHPIFQTMMTFQQARYASDELLSLWMGESLTSSINWGGAELSAFPHPPYGDTSVPLMVNVLEVGGQIRCDFRYSTSEFDAEIITQLMGHLFTLLAQMADDEQQYLSSLVLLSEQERRQVLLDFNNTTKTYPQDKLIHQLIEQQVERTPEAVALRYGDEQLSYSELNCRANQLAHYLIESGVGPDDRVAICAERSLEMVVGLLGVLKAGGAYVPLDPNYPPERLSYMLADCQPQVVLTQSGLLSVLPKISVPVLLLDIEPAVFREQPVHNPDAAVLGLKPDHLAYVIYTSGSTGQPKGVMNTHSGLSNLALVQAESFNIVAESRILQFASFSFDASVSEWAITLCRGASLCLVAREGLLPGEPLMQTLYHHKISHVTLPPSALYFLDATVLPEAITLIVAGEACPASLASQWTKKHRFFNAYGPSETTVCASIYECQAQQLDPLPIGRPISNTQIYILDSQNQPVPVGVTGEIHIGGVGVARGYLNRPELTAERFIADPFSDKTGARLYKTGDLGRWLPDGNIAYLGRNDFQIKIRGFRIELGEIETRLAACDGVREAVVVARDTTPGDRRLVAYLVPQAGMVLDAATLRAKLSTSLADYMLPSAFVVLEALPLTPNGKLDRQALPAPDQGALVTREYEAPQGEIEQQLAQIWQDLLGVERIGRHDNFFELGGHSLLAMSLVERLRQYLDTEMVLGDIFAEKTISKLAISIQSSSNLNQYSNLFPIRTGGKDIPLFFVHDGNGSISYAYDLVTWMDDISIPVYGFSASNLLEKEAKEGSLATIQKLAESYIESMLHVQPVGPYRIVAWSSGGVIAYEMARQLIVAGEKMDFIGLIDTDTDYKQFYPDDEKTKPFVFDEMAKLIEILSTLEIPDIVISKLIKLAKNKDYTAVLQLVKESGSVNNLPEYSSLRKFLLICHNMNVASYHYCPPKLPTMITLFSAMGENRSDLSLGWGNLISDGLLRIVPLRGTHSSIMKKPYISHLGKELLRSIKTKDKSN